MATIEDKLTAKIVSLKPFNYDQARSALRWASNSSAI
jgi:hypothetical protein